MIHSRPTTSARGVFELCEAWRDDYGFPRGLSFDSGGRLVASVRCDGSIGTWLVEGDQLHADAREPSGVAIIDIAISPDGTRVAQISQSGQIQIWRVGYY